jgi:type I restriction enzyme S subunit
VRESVNFSAFANLTIPLPEMNIQKEIVSQLNNTKDEINILKKIKKNLNLQKQALMQKLLTGKWRVDFKEEKNNE